MKAIVYEHYGPPDVLKQAEIAKPSPKQHEVLIRVRAVEVTKTDIELRRFKFGVLWFWLPMRLFWGIFKPRRQILGGYFSGEVEAVGESVTRFKVGDKLMGGTKMVQGAYAEYITLPEDYPLCPIPNNMNFEQAASVPLGGWNGLHFMNRAGIQLGEQVLINGAGGCIGAWAIQIAKVKGAEVTAIDIEEKAEGLRQLGADHVIDFTKENFRDSDKTYDIIFDMVPGSSYLSCRKKLNKKGRYLKGNPRFLELWQSLFVGWFSDKTMIVAFAKESVEELEELKNLVEAEKLGAIVDSTFSMQEIVEAHKKVEAEQRVGAIILSVN